MLSNERLKAIVSLLGTSGWSMIEDEIIYHDESLKRITEEDIENSLLMILKESQKVEINTAKKERQLLSVTVRGVKFYGGRTAGQKYDEAFRLAKMMGFSEGNFQSVDSGMVVVDEVYANEIIIAVASTSYRLWAKEQEYIAQVDMATTAEEVEAITWED